MGGFLLYRIAKTDASHVDGKIITLSDIQMGKIMAEPEKLKALQSGDFLFAIPQPPVKAQTPVQKNAPVGEPTRKQTR